MSVVPFTMHWIVMRRMLGHGIVNMLVLVLILMRAADRTAAKQCEHAGQKNGE